MSTAVDIMHQQYKKCYKSFYPDYNNIYKTISYTLKNNLKKICLLANICSKANVSTHRSFEKYIYCFFFCNQTKWEQVKCLVEQMFEV